MLEAKDLSHAFECPLFDNINLTIAPKDSIAILGASGSGKSTLLHNLSTFLPPQHGTVLFNNIDIYAISQKERLKIRRDYFSVIFQQHYLLRGFTGLENVKVASLLSNKEIDLALAKRFGIDDVMSQNSSTLSGGQQQRVSIVRTLTKKPKMIFADEPTGNLDKSTANEVLNAILEYVESADAGLVCVTHDESVAAKCKRIFRLENRQLLRV
jgi:putative ABC transport system ATP-binding protein